MLFSDRPQFTIADSSRLYEQVVLAAGVGDSYVGRIRTHGSETGVYATVSARNSAASYRRPPTATVDARVRRDGLREDAARQARESA